MAKKKGIIHKLRNRGKEKLEKSPEDSLEKSKKVNSEIKKGIEKIKNFKSTKKEILDSYEIEIDKAKVKIEIEKSLTAVIYNLYVPEIGVATKSLLYEIRNELVSATTIGMKEITDPTAFGRIKKRFMEDASKLVKEKLPHIDVLMKDFLVGKLIQEMLGLGEIEFLINDPFLEEVVIPSAKEPIRVYHKKFGWLKSNINILKEDEIINYSNIIARRVGRQINVLTPLLDAHLISGDRVNAILYPISTKGNTITIRKFARDPYTMIDLIENKTCNLEVVALLWLATEYEMNIIISGGTASGKTVVLNACMPFIPPNHRVISVEDTRELILPDFLYWTPLVTRTANPEGKGEVSMLDLLVNSLRMRPDRIILGEMRRKEEATVLFEAMHTGHSVFSTLHADSAAETISRLINPPLSIPANLLKAVNLNVVMFRDRKKGVRRMLQVAEFEEVQDSVRANILYRWIPEGDKIIKHAESSTLYETLARNTGRSQIQIEEDLDEKKSILEWMIKNKVRDLKSFGKITNLYYSNRELLTKSVKNNNLKKVLGI
ncbi:MAG: CpaF family protein [Nanoarchaeota archaeon]|nr:CpaF family protein [Nanoarchaeota archaeon]